jgi:hypothetical protein
MQNEGSSSGPVKVKDYEISNFNDAMGMIMRVMGIIHEQVLKGDEATKALGLSNTGQIFEFFLDKGWISAQKE